MLIKLFKNYQADLQDVRCLITIAPDQHPSAPKFLNDINKYGLKNQILNIGPLKQEQLAEYFYHSNALMFPTLMESFSGTYLEAMHFGLPILTSDLDFAHYVCDDAAIYFDPWSASDIAEKIVMLKNNENLRTDLIEKGKRRLSSFFISWEEITKSVIKELENIAIQHNPSLKRI
jgi:glycosyltransferase involved in cell wall biosynthesis